MDWNWFYSSLAQSTAAIVGVFAAFIITKVINSQAAFDQKRRQLDELITNGKILQSKAESRRFSWYNEQLRSRGLVKLDNSLRRQHSRSDAEKYHRDIEFSRYDSKPEVVEAIKSKIKAWNEFHKAKNQEKATGDIIVPPVSQSATSDPGEVKREVELIESLRIEIEGHISRAKDFLKENRSNPEYSLFARVSIIVSMLLFLAGVIWPLSFLPYDAPRPIQLSDLSLLGVFDILISFKGILLSIVSLIFVCVMIALLLVNRRLRFDLIKMAELERYTSYAAYSEHFVNYERNQCGI
jgi:hypothetical protein